MITDFDEKLYGVFGDTVAVLVQKQDPEVLGKTVKEIVAKNKKLELLLLMATKKNWDMSLPDAELGSLIILSFKSARQSLIDLIDLGMVISTCIDTYTEQDEMLKALTGYDFGEVADMLVKYEKDYEEFIK